MRSIQNTSSVSYVKEVYFSWIEAHPYINASNVLDA